MAVKMRVYNGKLARISFILVVSAITTITILTVQQDNFVTNLAIPNANVAEFENDIFQNFNINDTMEGKWRHLTINQTSRLSKLGKILYLDEIYPRPEINKKYKILVWKYGNTTNDRHIKRYSKERHDPFEFCSVRNCEVTYKDDDINTADLVIVHLHRTKNAKDLPSQEERNQKQIWAFSTDESPYHTFLYGQNALSDFNGVFNWSMTYRMDSDIPVPYGRTTIRENYNPDYKFNVYTWLLTKKHDVLVTIMGSNCGSKNHRWEYVKELQKYINVDVYGACGTLSCKGHFRLDCPEISKYMFYLSFENSNCDEYITEKLWWNAYAKTSIPIVMGATKSSYGNLVPPHSYINVEDFATPRDLATYITYLSNTPIELQRYFQWKKYFKVLNEHGYFQSVSYHYCRACEALNYNKKDKKVYNDLSSFWSVKSNCYPAWDAQT